MRQNSSNNRARSPYKEDHIISLKNTEDEVKLMDFLCAKMHDAKRNDIKKWMKYGHIKINGAIKQKFDDMVAQEAIVELNISRPFPCFSHPRVQLVYEDEHVIVINKGYGLLSVGAQNHKKEINAYDIVRNYVKQKDPRSKLFIVHRLDRDTSGLMMFVKTEEAQDVLRHNWNNMILERLYVAVLEGYLEQDKGYVKSRLAENSQYVVYSTENPDEGRLAVTHYQAIEKGNGYTLAEFSLDTGRKNQIRVHAKDLGHPITGDKKYGAKRSPLHRLALHALTLRFAHPITRKDMYFETPIPQKFRDAVRKHL